MDAIHWLMAANAALWIGLGKQRALEARLARLAADNTPEDDNE